MANKTATHIEGEGGGGGACIGEWMESFLIVHSFFATRPFIYIPKHSALRGCVCLTTFRPRRSRSIMRAFRVDPATLSLWLVGWLAGWLTSSDG